MTTKDIEVKFEKKDFLKNEMRYFDKKARRLAHIIYKNPKLIDTLADFLLNFVNKINFEKRYKKWKKGLGDIDLLYGKKATDEFLKLIYDSYKALELYQQHIDKFRGIVFEYIMELYYKDIYNKNGDNFGSGCKVTIDGDEIIYICKEDDKKSRQTIDIAGYNKKDSKFYELKVGPEGFSSHVIQYLNILNNNANEKEISEDITVGCMILDSKLKLMIKISSNDEDFSNLELNGIREVKKLLMERVS